MTVTITNEQIAHLWAHVVKNNVGCWGWRGATRNGYGVVSLLHRVHYAHRLVYQLTHGDLPDGLSVLHHCDNPPCVRPDHLYAGTASDNMNDAYRRGRWKRKTKPKGCDPLRFARYRERQRAKRAMLPKVSCACGCGTQIPSVNSMGKPANYALGHNPGGENTQFLPGQQAWNEGVPMSPEAKAKMITTRQNH